MVKKVDGIFLISKSVENSFLRIIPFARNKIILNYNGIDLTNFKPNFQDCHLPIRLIYVGRLIPQKGVQNILDQKS